MRLFGYDITLKATPAGLQSVRSSSWRNWFGPVMEPYAGAWQRNVTADRQTLLASSAVYLCVTGIASDIAKNPIKLYDKSKGIWAEITDSPYLKVLHTPNHFQIPIDFIESWILSKLLCGNTYVYKEREPIRGLVRALYVLDPALVTPLVAPDSSVYYELRRDDLSGIEDTITVPASEIIHDHLAGLFHELVGVSPLFACAMTATMQNKIQNDSTSFFNNRSMPGGVVEVPGPITQEAADSIKSQFHANYSGVNMGKTAVLSDSMKFTPIRATNENSQLAELLKFTWEDVGRAFDFPQHRLGGAFPAYSEGPEAVTTMYYSCCLQKYIEKLEQHLDRGLELPSNYGTAMDLDNLMRMDTGSLYKSNKEAVSGGWMTPNEARFRANLPPVTGGESPMIQQQNFSLEALAKRDAKEDPFAKEGVTAPKPPPQLEAPPEKGLTPEDIAFFEAELEAELELV